MEKFWINELIYNNQRKDFIGFNGNNIIVDNKIVITNIFVGMEKDFVITLCNI